MEDGTLTMALAAPTGIGGWTILYEQSLRENGVPFITKSCASGFGNGVSGITVANSGQGIINVALYGTDMAAAAAPVSSGNQDLSYYYRIRRADSGFATTLTEGFRIASP